MFAILLHKIVAWFDAAQRDRWESYLVASSDLAQVEQGIRKLEETRPTL
jgi:hypothetical protein